MENFFFTFNSNDTNVHGKCFVPLLSKLTRYLKYSRYARVLRFIVSQFLPRKEVHSLSKVGRFTATPSTLSAHEKSYANVHILDYGTVKRDWTTSEQMAGNYRVFKNYFIRCIDFILIQRTVTRVFRKSISVD